MDEGQEPTAISIMESLATLLAHQHGCTVKDLVITKVKKTEDTEKEPA